MTNEPADTLKGQTRGRSSVYGATLLALVLLPLLSICSLAIGEVSVGWSDVLDDQALGFQVLWQLRLPHLLVTLLAGALLGITGAAMQALFRNPLADPGLIGVSSGAALAAVVVMVLVSPWVAAQWLTWLMPLAAFVGGVLTTALVAVLARRVLNGSVMGMLLLGIAVNAMAVAAMGGLKFIADGLTLRQVVLWLMGGFSHVTWAEVALLTVIFVPVLWLMLRFAARLNLLLLGEQQAKLLGVPLSQLQTRLVLTTSAGVAAVVCVGGLIGYVSLLVPHAVRMWLGPEHQRLLPFSALYGALFLVLADVLARVLVSPAQLPLGVVTTLIGGPCFLVMIVAYYRGRLHA